jgi:hypothetical protein
MIVASLTQLDSIKVAFFMRLLPCTHAGSRCGANQRHNAGCRLNGWKYSPSWIEGKLLFISYLAQSEHRLVRFLALCSGPAAC